MGSSTERRCTPPCNQGRADNARSIPSWEAAKGPKWGGDCSSGGTGGSGLAGWGWTVVPFDSGVIGEAEGVEDGGEGRRWLLMVVCSGMEDDGQGCTVLYRVA